VCQNLWSQQLSRKKRLVIVRLMGGLGNQMFQYAMGRALANTRQAPVKINFEFLKADAKRTCGAEAAGRTALALSGVKFLAYASRPPRAQR
jgi:hypothetical protein